VTLPRWLPWSLLALAVAFGGVTRRDAAFARGEARRLERVADSLARRTARVDTQFRRDTIRFTRWRDRVVTLRESLTVTDTVEVVRFIAAQDSTIQACSAALLTCDERVRLRDARFDAAASAWRAERAVLAARVPTLTDKLRTAALWSGVGALAVTVLRR
jgi:hypothetical protein